MAIIICQRFLRINKWRSRCKIVIVNVVWWSDHLIIITIWYKYNLTTSLQNEKTILNLNYSIGSESQLDEILFSFGGLLDSIVLESINCNRELQFFFLLLRFSTVIEPQSCYEQGDAFEQVARSSHKPTNARTHAQTLNATRHIVCAKRNFSLISQLVWPPMLFIVQSYINWYKMRWDEMRWEQTWSWKIVRDIGLFFFLVSFHVLVQNSISFCCCFSQFSLPI